MRRALHISPNAYKSIGEITGTKAIWNELSKEYDEYHILARATDNKSHEYTEGKIHMHLVPGFKRPRSFFVTSYFGLKKMLKKYDYDILICQCGIFGGFWAVRNSMNIPVLMEIHEIFYFNYLENNDLLSSMLKPIIRYSYNNATILRSLNEEMTARLKKDGIINKHIMEVYNRVDTTLFRSERIGYELHSPIKLISIGNFVDSKDHLNLLKAVALLKDDYDIQVTIIGGGPLRESYETFIHENKLNVELIDRCPQSELVQKLEVSDLYVHSSWREGMPRTILEAMAMRLPVIATAAGFTGGTIQDRVNGMLVETRNSRALSEAIKEVIDDINLREYIARKGYEDVIEKYEWNMCFNRYREILKETERIGMKNRI